MGGDNQKQYGKWQYHDYEQIIYFCLEFSLILKESKTQNERKTFYTLYCDIY